MMTIKTKAELKEYIEADLFRYCGKRDKKNLRKYKRASSGFRFTYYMRKCNYYRGCTFPQKLMSIPYRILKDRTGVKFGYDIYELTQIGKGFHIAHFGGIVVHADAVLGENASISQCVTVGNVIKDGKELVPVIGDNVYLAPGCKVIGGIRVGNNVTVGANAVVTKDLPDNSVAAGVPAKVIKLNKKNEYIINPIPTERDN